MCVTHSWNRVRDPERSWALGVRLAGDQGHGWGLARIEETTPPITYDPDDATVRSRALNARLEQLLVCSSNPTHHASGRGD